MLLEARGAADGRAAQPVGPGHRNPQAAPRACPRVSRLAAVELSHSEALTLLGLVQGRLLETERIVQNLEEGEGMDLPRHNALRTLRPQLEALNDLVLKLEGAVKEIEAKR